MATSARAPWIDQSGDDVVLRVLVVPNASREGVVGPHADRLKIRVSAAPERGKVNAAVVSLLLKATGLKQGMVETGMSDRRKTVRLHGAKAADVERVLIDPA